MDKPAPNPMPTISARKILDYISDSIICLDESLVIKQVNATAQVFFDTSDSVLVGRPIASLFDPKAENSLLQSLHKCLREQHQITEHQARLHLANGKVLSTDYTVHPVQEIDAHTLLLEIQPIDRHLEIARDSQRVAQQIASQQPVRGMAHEIRNPLGGIRGAAQLLDSEIDDPALKEYTAVIIREVDRLQHLLNDMLGPNRRIEKTSINILEVLEHVANLIQAEYAEIEIVRDYDPSIPDLMADKDQLIQSFLNIGRNGAQAMDGKGELVFRTRINRQQTIGNRRYRHVIEATVIDHGPGIDPSVQENIFLPMVTSKPEGSGLGLPIAQQIIFGHGGLIQCSREGDRTLFTTFLPLEMS